MNVMTLSRSDCSIISPGMFGCEDSSHADSDVCDTPGVFAMWWNVGAPVAVVIGLHNALRRTIQNRLSGMGAGKKRSIPGKFKTRLSILWVFGIGGSRFAGGSWFAIGLGVRSSRLNRLFRTQSA